MKHADQGIMRKGNAEEQPRDKERAQTVHKAEPEKSVSREATRDPKLNEAERTSGTVAGPDESCKTSRG